MNLKLKMARLKKRYTQKGLAEVIGVTAKYISQLETSDTLPSANLMKKIASALQCTEQELFFEDTAATVSETK